MKAAVTRPGARSEMKSRAHVCRQPLCGDGGGAAAAAASDAVGAAGLLWLRLWLWLWLWLRVWV